MLDFTPDNHTLTITFTDEDGNEGSSQFNFTGQTREGESIQHYCCAVHSPLYLHTAVSISLVGEDFVNVTESGLTLTIQLEVTGYSFGVVPLRILPVTYSQFDELREMFGVKSTLSDIAGSRVIPSQPALPCE